VGGGPWKFNAGSMDIVFYSLLLADAAFFIACMDGTGKIMQKAGYKILSVVDPSGEITGRQALIYCIALIPASLLPTLVGMAGVAYFVGWFCLRWFFGAGDFDVPISYPLNGTPIVLCVLVFFLFYFFFLMTFPKV